MRSHCALSCQDPAEGCPHLLSLTVHHHHLSHHINITNNTHSSLHTPYPILETETKGHTQPAIRHQTLQEKPGSASFMSGPIENLKSFGTFPRLTRKLLRLGVATRALLGHTCDPVPAPSPAGVAASFARRADSCVKRGAAVKANLGHIHQAQEHQANQTL
jgi:hypothetical protein